MNAAHFVRAYRQIEAAKVLTGIDIILVNSRIITKFTVCFMITFEQGMNEQFAVVYKAGIIHYLVRALACKNVFTGGSGVG